MNGKPNQFTDLYRKDEGNRANTHMHEHAGTAAGNQNQDLLASECPCTGWQRIQRSFMYGGCLYRLLTKRARKIRCPGNETSEQVFSTKVVRWQLAEDVRKATECIPVDSTITHTTSAKHSRKSNHNVASPSRPATKTRKACKQWKRKDPWILWLYRIKVACLEEKVCLLA